MQAGGIFTAVKDGAAVAKEIMNGGLSPDSIKKLMGVAKGIVPGLDENKMFKEVERLTDFAVNHGGEVKKLAEDLKNGKLSPEAAKKILDLVRTGNLKPGDQLPPERDLAQMLQVSRPSLREAMRGLQILGVVKSRQGGGAYISSLDAADLLGPLQFLITLNAQNVHALYESRVLGLDVQVEADRLRFYAGTALLLESDDLIARLEQMVDHAQQRAEEEAHRREEETRRAAQETRRAEEETRLREEAEREIARLRAELERLKR